LKTKDRFETGVKYVDRDFLPLEEFRTLAGTNEQAMAWGLGGE
jgi:hypothetical protein